MYFDTVLLLILVSCGYYIRKCARINILGTFSHITGKYQYLPCNINIAGQTGNHIVALNGFINPLQQPQCSELRSASRRKW